MKWGERKGKGKKRSELLNIFFKAHVETPNDYSYNLSSGMTFVWLHINYTWQWNPNVSSAIFMYRWSCEGAQWYSWSCEGTLGYMVVTSLHLGAKVTVAMRLGVGTKNIYRQSTFSRKQPCQVTGTRLEPSLFRWLRAPQCSGVVPLCTQEWFSIEGYCENMRYLCFYLLFFPHPFLPNLALHTMANQSENCCKNHICL